MIPYRAVFYFSVLCTLVFHTLPLQYSVFRTRAYNSKFHTYQYSLQVGISFQYSVHFNILCLCIPLQWPVHFCIPYISVFRAHPIHYRFLHTTVISTFQYSMHLRWELIHSSIPYTSVFLTWLHPFYSASFNLKSLSIFFFTFCFLCLPLSIPLSFFLLSLLPGEILLSLFFTSFSQTLFFFRPG